MLLASVSYECAKVISRQTLSATLSRSSCAGATVVRVAVCVAAASGELGTAWATKRAHTGRERGRSHAVGEEADIARFRVNVWLSFSANYSCNDERAMYFFSLYSVVVQ